MVITTFDTLEFVRKLEKVGVPSEQAEVQAQVLTEAFNVNLESLVTKEYLDARLAEQSARMDVRFAELKSDLDTRLDTSIARLKSEFETRFQVQTTLLGIILIAVVIPLVQRAAGL